MEFALNLPWEYKVGSVTKPILKDYFQKCWPEQTVLPKQGFAGHANDALPYLGIEIDPTGDRHLDWKQIAQKTFYEYSLED
jgi:hypothetical protein